MPEAADHQSKVYEPGAADEARAIGALHILCFYLLEATLDQVITWPSGDQITDAIQTLAADLELV